MPSSKRFFKNTLSPFDSQHLATEDDILNRYKPGLVKEIEKVVELLRSNVKPHPRQEDGGLYVGLSGISYSLFYTSQCLLLSPEIRQSCLTLAGKLLEASLEYCAKTSEERRKTGVAFFLGHLGVYAYAAVYFHTIGQASESKKYLDKFISLHEMCEPVDFLKCGGDEMLVGRAGYLCGVKFLRQNLNSEVVPRAVIQKVISSILTSGRILASRTRAPIPLMYEYYGTKYVGAAHGFSGILQMMLSFPECLDEAALSDIKSTSDSIISLQTDFSNYPAVLDEAGGDLYHWCHGSPGVIYFLIKLQQVFNDPTIHQHVMIAGGDNLWKYGLLRKGPGICHGVAGNGYAFLALYRYSGDLKHLYRAQEYGSFLFTPEFMDNARQPDCPFSLFEGWAGTLCYLVDLLQPQSSSFPFSNVFC